MEEVMVLRAQAPNKVCVRGRVIGGEYQLICLPLVGEDLQDLLEQARDIMTLKPDLIEWRADSFNDVTDIKGVLHRLREVIKDIPLIFTLRHHQEGGAREILQDIRVSVIKEAVGSGLVDLVDFEIMNGNALIAEVKEIVHKFDVKLILSHHDFVQTPLEGFIVAKLKEAQELGADIAKLAAMPNNYRDVLVLLSATLTARNGILDIPIITMSMGTMGVLSRIVGGYFGSDVTFAVGKYASAPGQIRIEDLRNITGIIG